jgi:AcrR family transcriptional regulator
VTPDQLAALPLRDRKKALTRAAIVEAAQRLFEERGFDNVTVAQIADAANVSVKTLFAYFRAKEDLVFADNHLIDAIIDAMAERPPGTTHAQAVAALLAAEARAQGDPTAGLEGFHRGYGQSAAVQPGLLRMWADFEDRITAFLAAEAGTGPTPDLRLQAAQLVAMLRTLTGPEMRAAIAGQSPGQAADHLDSWLQDAAATLGPAPRPR